MNLPNSFLRSCLPDKDSDRLMALYARYLGYAINEGDANVYGCACSGMACAECLAKSRSYDLEWHDVCPVCSYELTRTTLWPARHTICVGCRSMTRICIVCGMTPFITAVVVPSRTLTEIIRTADDVI